MNYSQNTSWSLIRQTFKEIWGYDDFRSPQGEIIQSLLTGKDTLIIMPTGGGKSICFQLPALLQTGVTLVLSPLVALMENQVQELLDKSLPVALIHSQISTQQRRKTLHNLAQNQLRLLYLSPETLLSPPVWEILLKPEVKINGLILDEAHCLVQWGDTFRPTYRRLGVVRSTLLKAHNNPDLKIPIAAFTATANPQAQAIITSVLQLDNPAEFLLSPYRANLHLKIQVAWTPKCRRDQLLKFIKNHANQTGLVYVRTRRESEELATLLNEKNYQTMSYHAGLSARERRQIETDWLTDQIKFVICTSAFGMGINKSDVRWVIHWQPPLLLSEYIQEVGRGGRDGKPSTALTLVSEPTGWLDSTDQQMWDFFEKQSQKQVKKAENLLKKLPNQGNINEVNQLDQEGAIALAILHSKNQLIWRDPFNFTISKIGASAVSKDMNKQALKEMKNYLTTRQCRWGYLLQAFGFGEVGNKMRCGHCDNCLK